MGPSTLSSPRDVFPSPRTILRHSFGCGGRETGLLLEAESRQASTEPTLSLPFWLTLGMRGQENRPLAPSCDLSHQAPQLRHWREGTLTVAVNAPTRGDGGERGDRGGVLKPGPQTASLSLNLTARVKTQASQRQTPLQLGAPLRLQPLCLARRWRVTLQTHHLRK